MPVNEWQGSIKYWWNPPHIPEAGQVLNSQNSSLNDDFHNIPTFPSTSELGLTHLTETDGV